jgi:hypothetical protein
MSRTEKDAPILKLFDVLRGFERRLQDLESQVKRLASIRVSRRLRTARRKGPPNLGLKAKSRSGACQAIRERRGNWWSIRITIEAVV